MTNERVLLIDLDSTIPNLALMKISAFYKSKGCEVGFNVKDPTKAYISCIFKKNRKLAHMSANLLYLSYPDIQIDIGGSGYSLTKCLPDDIESMNPDYDLYPTIDYSLGFTTRGCIRKCPFCIVPKKEGKLHRVNRIEEIYNPRFNSIKLMDNNILADMENFREIVEFCKAHNLRVDFSQGLDARLLTEESASMLATLRPMKCWDFAFDSMSYRPSVERAIRLLKNAGIHLKNRVQFYVYCDQSDGEYGFDSALERCKLLKEWGTNPYVMLDIDSPPSQRMKDLKRWANRKHIFWSCDFQDYSRREYP